MNNFKIFIILLILLMVTTFLCILHPKMHKKVVIGDANISIEQTQDQNQPLKEISEPQQKQPLTLKEYQKKVIKKRNEADNEQTTTPKPLKQEESIKNNLKKSQVLQPIMLPEIKPQSLTQNKKQLTPEEEEIIAWNNWRSALQNQVMKDTKLAAPIGTVFKFSFTVDKYGTISNLKTWSENSEYTPMAVKIIKPRLMSYQGQSILNFPPKSKRVITNVNGGFTVWYTSGYSSPSDYSDYERVK